MKSLPLNALRAFAMTHEHGGVRAAARELGVAHSSVSRHLAELETWIGVPLFERGAATWTPSPQGVALARRVHELLQGMAEATAAAREAPSPFTVTIGVAPSFASRWLLPRLPTLERAHPRIGLSVLVNQQLDTLSEGVDLAVRMGSGPWAGLDCEPLMDDHLYPVVNTDFWRAANGSDAVESLLGLRLLHDRDPSASWEHWRRVHGPASLPLDHGARLTSSDLVLRAAELGQGIALARGRLAEDALVAGTLIRPFGDKAVHLPKAYWLVRPKRKAASPSQRHAVTAVVAWLKDQAG
ncbi:LysR substrate-binding domain-containing protein [Luteibacter sp. NPDC031894]|uniref:LysR substrate-binding domain-containing protein n=1 Tax=Luteibacter sp. NPDC031894 TaxID=3390572 RepID=UPI003CFE80E5